MKNNYKIIKTTNYDEWYDFCKMFERLDYDVEDLIIMIDLFKYLDEYPKQRKKMREILSKIMFQKDELIELLEDIEHDYKERHPKTDVQYYIPISK